MKANPPIPGHHLLFEGHTRLGFSSETAEPVHSGGCQCGAKPPNYPDVSVGAMKRWHRAHKAEIRGDEPAPLDAATIARVIELLKIREHRIRFHDYGWLIEHPLHEKLEDSLLDCDMRWDGEDIGYRGLYVLHDDGTIGDKIPW